MLRSAEQKIRQIEVAQIDPDPNNPRKEFAPDDLRELADSILRRGLLQPIVVRPQPKIVGQKSRYTVTVGERRWRAHGPGYLGWELIRAIVQTDVSEQEAALQQIVENARRRDVTAMEEAHAFKRAVDMGLSEEELAKEIGLGSQPWRIGYRLRLLKLDAPYQKLLEAGQITLNAAQEIAKLEPADQTRVVKQIASGALKGDAAVAAAVKTIEDDLSQEDIFGNGGRIVAAKDVDTIGRMEARIENVARMVSTGWRDGDCQVALKVSPDRAGLMADRIGEIRKALGVMEKQLRTAAAQASLVLDAA